jgi:hypothetical protein
VSDRTVDSDYMRFAKRETGARFNIASSGVADADLADIGVDLGGLTLHARGAEYGYAPLSQAIADRFGLDPACVVIPGGGCSFANHLAMAALLAPGDEVVVEAPTYPLMVSTLEFLGARVRRFHRRAEARWRLDPDALVITPATRLVVLTDLHNPTGAPAAEDDLAAVIAAAERVGARVLIDEVYRELTFADGQPSTAFAADRPVVVTSSLTKAYGLSGLRCGWILAAPPLAERMNALNDLFGVQPPHLMDQLAVAALRRLDTLAARARALIEANRASYLAVLGDHSALEAALFEPSTTVFPRVVGGGDALHARLRGRFETALVPGRFFGAPDHVRIGLGGDPAATREGLARVAEALAD